MPKYKYVCKQCGTDWKADLPISFDPSSNIPCVFRNCEGLGERRIIGSNSIKVERETLGKWYKNQTGKELLGDK